MPKEPMLHKGFAVFILTHGRADNVITAATLRKQGYTGQIYYIIDNEDAQGGEYRRKYGDAVVEFDKEYYFSNFDTMDAGGSRSVIFAARNACVDIAKEKGLTYFLELDDDYLGFEYRLTKGNKLYPFVYKNLNSVFDAYLDFLDVVPAVTVAFAQGGDCIGGSGNSRIYKGLSRKAMNAFFCRTDRPFRFIGRINEDVNTYSTLSNKGILFFTTCRSMIRQVQTQKQKGGMTDAYIDGGTYVKSFYSIVGSPQAVKISVMGDNHKRIHHFVKWNNCAPKILNPKFRKD